MADIFISYAKADRAKVAPLVAALEAEGWSVWWDREIVGGQEFDEMIMRELASARAAIVVWTKTSAGSRWVRGEARMAAERGVLIPVRLGDAELPLDARAIHTIDIDGWRRDARSQPYQALLRSIKSVISGGDPEVRAAQPQPAKAL